MRNLRKLVSWTKGRRVEANSHMEEASLLLSSREVGKVCLYITRVQNPASKSLA